MIYRCKRDTLCKNKEEIVLIENAYFHIAHADNTKLVLRSVRFLVFVLFLTKTELAWFKKNWQLCFGKSFPSSFVVNGR